jgi:peptidyl-prolyl cis-trans isomerase SurA
LKVVTMLKKLSPFAIAVLFFATAVYAQNTIIDEIIARVGDSAITKSDYERGKQTSLEDLQQRYPNDWQSKWGNRQKDVLRDLIDQQLLLAKGQELGITGETEVIKRLNEIRQQMGLSTMEDMEKAAQQQGVSYEDFKEKIKSDIVAQQVIGREVGSRIHITNEEVQAWYDKHQQELKSDESVRLAEILVPIEPPKPVTDDKNKDKTAESAPVVEDPAKVAAAQDKAQKIMAAMKNGAAFQDLAKNFSSGSTAAQGGEIGTFKRGELAKELEEKTFSLKTGETTQPIRTKQGFLILKVLEHRSPGIPPLKEVDEKIRQAIYVEKFEPSARAYLTKLREEAYIEVHAPYIDTGASPNQSKPIVMAANTGEENIALDKEHKKKKKKFLLF